MSRSITIITIFTCMVANLEAALNFSNKNSTIKLKTANSALIVTTPITGFDGTLKIDVKGDNSVQGSAVNCITFDEGIVSSGKYSYMLTGTYNGTTTDTVALGAGDTIEVAAGTILQSVTVGGTVGSPSVIRGSPLFSGPIVINDSSSTLTLAIDNKLTQNVTLNGGKLTLGNDLALADGVFLSGNGTVDLANRTLQLAETASSPWTGNLTLNNARDIQLNGYTKLNGNWTFADNGGTSTINGNGNILDLSGGGTITVAPMHTLYLIDVQVKGLGSGLGTFALDATGGTLKLANVNLELGASYSLSAGEFYFQGDNCRVVSADTTGGNYTFDVSSTGTLTVDHGVLIYETLLGQNVSPFTFTSVGTQKNLINGGCIRSAIATTSAVDVVIDEAAVGAILNQNYDLTSQTHLVFTNIAGGAQTVSLDGGGYFIQFPYGASNFIQIANNLAVTLHDIVLKDFTTATTSYGTSSTLSFGDNAIIQLSSDILLDSSAKAWTFTGNGTIEANEQTITISAADKLTITGSKTLKIKNANLIIKHATGLRCLTNSATVQFINCNISVETSGFTFAAGNMSIQGDVVVRGNDSTNPSGSVPFTFSTPGSLTVKEASQLMFVGDLNFSYQPDVTVNTDTLVQSKRHFKLNDPSSRLVFDGCTVTSTSTGMALDYGKLYIVDRVKLNVSTSPLAEFEVGSALELIIRAGALLEVDGPLKYTSTTYP